MKANNFYKYLSIDENVIYVGPIDNNRITKEYCHRMIRIWNSEKSSFKKFSFNKLIEHNTLAVTDIIILLGIVD